MSSLGHRPAGDNPVMQVFELHYPGTWLDGVPNEVRMLLTQLELHLADAAVSLALFDAAPRPGAKQGQCHVRRP